MEVLPITEDVLKTAERYRTLVEINNAIITKLNQDELFRAICKALRGIVPCDRASLTIYEPEGQRLRVAALEGDFSSDVFRIGQTLRIDDSHAGWAFANQRVLLLRDLEIAREFPPEKQSNT